MVRVSKSISVGFPELEVRFNWGPHKRAFRGLGFRVYIGSPVLGKL